MLWVASDIAGDFIGRQSVTLSSLSFSVPPFIFRSRVLPGFLSYLIPPSYSLLSLLPFFPLAGIDQGFVAASRRIASSASFLSFDSEHREGMRLCSMGRPRPVSDHLWKEHCILAALRQHLTNHFQNLHPVVFRDS
jgi:hypothetical protein